MTGTIIKYWRILVDGFQNLDHNLRQTFSDIGESIQQFFAPKNSSDNNGPKSDDAISSRPQTAAQLATDRATDSSRPSNLIPRSSNRGPTTRFIDGDMTEYDGSTHRTDISSFNREGNTVKNSFNNRSFKLDYSS